MYTLPTLKCTRRLDPRDLHAAGEKKYELLDLKSQLLWSSSTRIFMKTTHISWDCLDPESSAPFLDLSCKKISN